MSTSAVGRFFRILGNDTRLVILSFLASRRVACVRDIVAGTGLRQSTVSMSLRALRECHCVEVERVGREHCYTLNAATLRPLLALVERHVSRAGRGGKRPLRR